MAIFEGSGVAIVTPFDRTTKKVDFDALGKLIDFQLENKTAAIIICGTTGEASTLTDAEQVECVKYTVERVNKRVPVIAGAGSNDTEHGIHLTKDCAKVGADAILSVTPYYNKTSQKGLIDHFTQIANSVDIPVILYNVPSRTGLNILPRTALALSNVENIVAIKEACGDLSQIADTAALCQGKLDVYSGNDDQITPIMALGAKGVISVLANVIPAETQEMAMSFLEGNVQRSIELQLKYLELVRALFCDVNPIPVKTALNLMGFDAGTFRAPLIEMETQTYEYLKTVLNNYGLMK